MSETELATRRVAARPLEPQAQQQKSQPARPKLSVLVLEDDELQMQVLSRHLESLNLEVLQASTIAAASKILRDKPVQLAILDIHLPDGSGLELCEQIDADPKLSGLPMIVLSSMTESDLVRRTRAAGGCYFIGKPYDPNVLLVIIERALGSELQ